MADRNDYFVYNEVSSADLGIHLLEPLIYGSAVPAVTSQKIPGRSGSLTYWDGSYQDITVTASCAMIADSITTAMQTLNQWLRSPGYYKLENSADPDTFYMAMLTGSPEFQPMQGNVAQFTLTWNCKPQKWITSGQTAITISGNQQITNDYFEAKPLIKIVYTADKTFVVGGQSYTIKHSSGHDTVYIDCELQEVYDDTSNLNSLFTSSTFPTIPVGTSLVSPCGTTFEITPRWWTL